MAYTREDADRLRSSIAKGVAETEINGERVKFRSLADMKETLVLIETELAGTVACARVSYPMATRGL